MKVADILRVKKSTTLFSVTGDQPLSDALATMAERDIGSLIVVDRGELAGMLTFREVIVAVVANAGSMDGTKVRSVMNKDPLTCTPDTELDEVRRMMLE